MKARAKPPAQGRLMWYGMASLQRPQIVAEIPRVQESEKAVIKTRPVTDPLRVPKWSDIKWNHSYQLMQALITVQLAVLKRNLVPRTRIRFHQGPLPIKIRNSRCLSTIRNPCPLMHLHWRARWQTQPRRPQPRISSNVTPCTIFMLPS